VVPSEKSSENQNVAVYTECRGGTRPRGSDPACRRTATLRRTERQRFNQLHAAMNCRRLRHELIDGGLRQIDEIIEDFGNASRKT
jgi:hypothetical protein